MLRHWTLMEAMMYAPYVAARLQTYRQGGVQKLNNLIAAMGVTTRAAEGTFREYLLLLLPILPAQHSHACSLKLHVMV